MAVNGIDTIDLSVLTQELRQLLSDLGFRVLDQYPAQAEIWEDRRRLAVISLKELRLTAETKTLFKNEYWVELLAEIRVRLAGRRCNYSDGEELQSLMDRTVAGLFGMFPGAELSLGPMNKDTSTQRLYRDLSVRTAVCLREGEKQSGTVQT